MMELEEKKKENCDMFETDLCRYYQKNPPCHYKTAHNVKCPVEDLNELLRIYQGSTRG